MPNELTDEQKRDLPHRVTSEGIMLLTQEEIDAQHVEAAEAAEKSRLWKIEEIRAQRNVLLSETDFTQLPDAPFTQQQKDAFAEYRQQLRDMLDNLQNPDEVNWPTKP